MKHKLLLTGLFMVLIIPLSFAWNAPTISSPASGSSVWIGVTVNWNAVSSSAGYQVQWDTVATFNSPVFHTNFKAYINTSGSNSDTEDYPANLFFGKTYYWRVRAYVTNDTSVWTNSTFITRDYVTQSSPTTGTDQWAGTSINWTPHVGVSFYDWQADTSATFTSAALRSGSNSYINSTDGNSDTQTFLNDIYFGKTYYWRVRARNAVDSCLWSTVWTFNVRDYVTQSSPTTGTDQWAGVNINWTPHVGVAFYDWQADTSSSFNSSVLRSGSTSYINSTDGNSDTQTFLTDTYFGKTYYWRVRARNAVDTSSWSTVWTFNVRDYVTQSSPTSGTDQWVGAIINWTPHVGVAFYDWQADTSATFTSAALRSGSNSYVNSTDGNSDTQTSLNDIYFGKTYYWRVRARNAVDTSSWSTVWTFNVRDYVTQSSPTTGSDQWSGATINWTPHVGVAFYDWQADTSASFNSSVLRSGSTSYVNSTDGNSDTQTFLTDTYFGKTYYWRVRARNAVDTCSWSTVWTFNVRDYVNLSNPADAALNVSVNPTLNWAPHTGVTYYQMQIDVSNLFNTANFLEVIKNYVNSTDGNSDTQQGLTGLTANTVYFWRVRAINGVDTSAWTQRWFSTGNAPVVLPPSPTVAAGNCGLTNQPFSGVTLNWTGTGTANSYQLEFTNSSLAFSGNPTVTGLTGTTYSTGALPQGSNYCWRVRAVEGTLASDWSAPCCFTVAQPVSASISSVSQTSNCAGATVNVDFTSTGQYNSGNVFELELSNTGGTFSTPIVIGSLTSQSGGLVTGTLPSNLASGSYSVRIHATSPNFTSTGSTTFNVAALPSATINSNGLTEITCTTSSIILTASGGTSYTWNAGSSLNTASNTITSGGLYTVNVTQAGCSNSTSVTITQNTDGPAVFVDFQTAVCINGGLVELTGGLPEGGTWSGVAVSNGFFDPTSLTAGTYNPVYTYTAANGCSSSASGSISVDVCTYISDSEKDNIHIYPTLISNGFQIQVEQSEDILVQLFQADGRLVEQKIIQSSTWFDTIDLANGLYLLNLKLSNGKIKSIKLIK